MNQILVIAWREVTRLRKRFGGASPLVVLLLLAVFGWSAYYLRDTVMLGSGLYRVGVSGDVPPIRDSRFAVVALKAEVGQALLDQHVIDLWIDGPQVISRADDKSQFAVRALKQYMEQEELIRIGNSYSEADAFPLRLGINYLGAGQAAGNPLPAKPEQVIIPSLTPPPGPFAQVLIALIYVLPITFISIFFTSSFMDEKINRRLTILLSTPITPFQIILGKMLPYAGFALFGITLIALITKANLPLTLAIFAPTTLFVFAIYLMVPLFYRTFKDITFIAMLVTTLTTAYLIIPAMFTNVNDFSYISPLTLAVKMYKGELFGWREYLFPSLPMAAIFGLAIFAGTRMLNEEFLVGYKPLTRKLSDAVYLMLAHSRPAISIPLWSFLVVPIVYMAQIVFLAFATNLPAGLILGFTLFASALFEEIVKAIGILVLAEHGVVNSARSIIGLSFLSAFGFLVAEKLLVFLSISIVSAAPVAGVFLGEGLLLFIPLIAHFAFTTITTWLRIKLKFPYLLALGIGTLVHFIYNSYVLRGGF